MWRKNKLISNASIYVLGNFVQRAADFLLIPLWARFLTPADYGITGTLNAYSGVLVVILHLNLHSAVSRFYYDHIDDHPTQKSDITSIYCFQLGYGLLLTALLTLFFSWSWTLVAGDSIPFLPYVPLMLWTSYLRGLIHIPSALYQVQQKPKSFLAIQYTSFGLSFIASMIFVVGLSMGAYGQMVSQLIAAGLTGLVGLVLVARSWFTSRVNFKYIRYAAAYSLPLVPHALAAWALNAADRVILSRYVSLPEVGLYNLGYNFGMAMQLVVYAINQAWSPYYFQMMKNDATPEPKIIRIVSIYIAITSAICMIGTAFIGEVVQLALPEKYFGGIPYIGPVMLGYVFLGMYYFAVSPIFYFKKTRYIPLLTGFSAIFNIVLNLVFVPQYGAMASAWLTTITYAILIIPTGLISRRLQSIQYPWVRYITVFSLLAAGVILFNQMPIFVLTSIIIKLLLLVIFILVVFRLLVKPYLSSLFLLKA